MKIVTNENIGNVITLENGNKFTIAEKSNIDFKLLSIITVNHLIKHNKVVSIDYAK